MLLSTFCFGEIGDSISTLEDGLLLTKADQLRVQSAEWTVLVVIETPQIDPTLVKNIGIVLGQITKAHTQGIISNVQSVSWIGRLNFLKTYLGRGSGNLYEASTPSTPTRVRRGWMDFMGQIGHTMFGLATDDSIAECRHAIRNSRKYQQEIVHQLNAQTTILNRTQRAVAWNRHQIAQVTDFISNRLIPKINRALSNLNYTYNRVYRLERAFYFERVVATLEQVVVSYVHLMRTHARQKASLEMGRLTEDILGIAQLQDILSRATSTTTVPLDAPG